MWRGNPGVSAIPLSQLKETAVEIAHGAYSDIIKGMDLRSNTEVAIKRISPRFFTDQPPEDREGKAVSLFENEKAKLEFLSQLNAPNVVKYFGYTTRQENYCIVTEITPYGSLDKHLLALMTNPLSSYNVMQCAVRGLEFMHRHDLLHCDIKPPNLLIFPFWEAKWCDFGLALSVKSTEWIRDDMYRGTPTYMAPEVLRKEKVGKKSDVFSFGIFLYEMLYGKNPNRKYVSHQALEDSYEVGTRKPFPVKGRKNKAEQLMAWCAEYNPLDRPDMTQLLNAFTLPADQLVDESKFRKKLLLDKLANEIKAILSKLIEVKLAIETAAKGLISELETLDIETAAIKKTELIKLHILLAQCEFLQNIKDPVDYANFAVDNDFFTLAEILDAVIYGGFVAPSMPTVASFHAMYWIFLHESSLKKIFSQLNFTSGSTQLFNNLDLLISCLKKFNDVFNHIAKMFEEIENEEVWDSIKFKLPLAFTSHLYSFHNTVLAFNHILFLTVELDFDTEAKLLASNKDAVLDFITTIIGGCLKVSESSKDFSDVVVLFNREIKALLARSEPMRLFSHPVANKPEDESGVKAGATFRKTRSNDS